MNSEIQKKIDDIMIETNEKVSAIVNEIRDIRFSKMNEQDKETKCDKLREEFEKIMIEEERKIEKIMADSNENWWCRFRLWNSKDRITNSLTGAVVFKEETVEFTMAGFHLKFQGVFLIF